MSNIITTNSFLKINDTDISNLVQEMRVSYETLVSSDSGRNANGDTVIDIINSKHKLYIKFRPMDGQEMSNFLTLINDYVVSVSYRDSKTNAINTITCYTGTPAPEYYWIQNDQVLYKALKVNFIEL